ncbi:MAG: zf-HC2 domain-containing protein [Gemmatimonadaceae bacterium]
MTGSRIPPLPPECLEVLQHVWDYLDDQLTEETTGRLRAHLDKCQGCFRYKTFQENFLEAVGTLRRRTSASPELQDKVLGSLRQEGFAR